VHFRINEAGQTIFFTKILYFLLTTSIFLNSW